MSNDNLLKQELKKICDCLTIMIKAYRYIGGLHPYSNCDENITIRNQKIKDCQYQFNIQSQIFNDLINNYFNLNSNNFLTKLRVDCDIYWGTIHVKQPISPLHYVNEQDSKVIILKERIQKLRLDLGVGGSDLAYKLNFLDIAL